MIVAVDANGVERGPRTLIDGVRSAAADGIGIRLFGDSALLSDLAGDPGIELISTADAIANTDEPVAAVRSRDDASIVVAARDVAQGNSDALVSAGPTGATMAAALFALRRLSGIRRAALAAQLPTPGLDAAPTLLLDVGANAEVRSQDLVQFAVLGAAFSRVVLQLPTPRVALLSVGEEDKKGTQAVVDAHATLASLDGIGFTGNVEGRDLLTGAADVVVTDGFTGNVTLKTLEGTAKAVAGAVSAAARSNPVAAVGGLLLRPALGGLRKEMNPDMTGGAILLGLRGVAVVAHGSSGPDGIANAIRLAARSARDRTVEQTDELLGEVGATRGDLK